MTHSNSFQMPASKVLLVEALAAGNDSGLGRHVRLLLHSLADLGPEWSIHVLWPDGCTFECPTGLIVHKVRPLVMSWWIQWMLPLWAGRIGAQLVLHLGYTLPKRPLPIPSILLVPDVGPLEPGAMRMSKHAVKNRAILSQQIPKALGCLVSTDFTRSRLQELLRYPKEKVFVLPPFGAYTKAWKDETDLDGALRRRFPNGFILAVGNVEPRKNYPGLVRGYAHMLKRVNPSPGLVIVGHHAWGFDDLREAIALTGTGTQVHCLGHIPDPELGAYFRQALLFVSASLYEGFGMPLFEAMCLGKACLFHRESCQREFAGDVAWGVNAADEQELGEALTTLLQDPIARERYSRLAREKAQRLSQLDKTGELKTALIAALQPLN
jgi:glycosyltransferase involved in cell wall biosynthesis